MNISTEPRHRPKTVQPIPDYNQDAEHVTEILVDITQNNNKSILKNQGSYTTAHQSPPKTQPTNPIRASIIRSPTMNVAPDCHQHRELSDRTTTEAVDMASPTIKTETTISKPKTKRIKRSLLLEPSVNNETQFSTPTLNSQLRNEIDTNRYIMAAEPNMQSETQPGVANGTPQQDKSKSHPLTSLTSPIPLKPTNIPATKSSIKSKKEPTHHST